MNPSAEPTPITVAILEDNQPLLKGMCLELEKPDIHVCVSLDQPDEFLQAVRSCLPTVAIIDLRIWHDFEAGFSAIRRIQELSPLTQCIIYTAYEQLENFHRGINLGIKAYVTKNITEIPLEKVVRIVAGGGSYYGDFLPRYLARIKEMPAAPEEEELAAAASGRLSQRELEILRLFAEGRSEEDISASLHLSANTVKAHTKNVRGKLGVKTTLEAVRLARLRGLL